MKMKRSNRAVLILVVATILGNLLVGCSSGTPLSMPAPQVTRYVLDISGSNDALDQYARLKPAIYSELKSESIGNPFAAKPSGPVDLSMTFIVGSASQARVTSIISSDFGNKLFKYLGEVIGRSNEQMHDDWKLVLEANRKALDSKTGSTINECVNASFGIMEVNLGEEDSKSLSQKLCIQAFEVINTIESQIPNSISESSGSDIFGAFRELDTWIEKVRKIQTKSKIKVVFASDMVHWTNGQRDLFGARGLLTGKVGKDEICAIANDQASKSALNFKGVEVDIIGRGNSTSVSADQGEALAIFWKCFAEASNFELNTLTDGRA